MAAMARTPFSTLFAKELSLLTSRICPSRPGTPAPQSYFDIRGQGADKRPAFQQSDAGDRNTPSPEPKPPTAGPSRSQPTTPTPLHVPSPSGPVCSFGPRLAFTYFADPLPDAAALNAVSPDSFWFTIDHLLLYLSFFQDTGPLNCACLYRFCLHLHGLIEDVSPTSPTKDKRIILYSSEDPDKKANAALLMSLYCMIVLRWSPADALHPVAQLELQPFRDAGYARANFHLSLQNVLFGIKRAIDLRLLRLDEFDLKEYETYEKVENGDYNWLSPNFIAFASPTEPGYSATGTPAREKPLPSRLPWAFRQVLTRFEKAGVKLVIRLNKKLYDEQHFMDRGMAHREMYFDDGTNPTMAMVREFIDICDKIVSQGGVIAVHCKAGLGRTGTLIGAYFIYKYGFTAEEAIGFMRIMRPGTCVGPQQHFLYENQMTWVRWAATDAALASRSPKVERPITPPSDREVAVPRTPERSERANSIVVPGQPRKTPGAKSRHMVAEPETLVTNPAEGGAGDMDEMQLVPTEEAERAVRRENEQAAHRAAAAARQHSANPDRASVTPVPPPTAASRIAKPRQRPLSALSDNRHVDRLGSLGRAHAHGSDNSVKRSKGVKNLGTLFEGLAQSGGPGSDSPDGGRYNLRGGGARTASHGSGVGLTPPGSMAAPITTRVNASPTRLPQRVPAKRRGPTREKPSPPAIHVTTPATGVTKSSAYPADGSHLIGPARSVRRRRSSLGAADVMA